MEKTVYINIIIFQFNKLLIYLFINFLLLIKKNKIYFEISEKKEKFQNFIFLYFLIKKKKNYFRCKQISRSISLKIAFL